MKQRWQWQGEELSRKWGARRFLRDCHQNWEEGVYECRLGKKYWAGMNG